MNPLPLLALYLLCALGTTLYALWEFQRPHRTLLTWDVVFFAFLLCVAGWWFLWLMKLPELWQDWRRR